MNRNRNLLFESELSRELDEIYHFTNSIDNLISILTSGELITADSLETKTKKEKNGKETTYTEWKYKAELIDGEPKYGISFTRNLGIYRNGTKAFKCGVIIDNQKFLKVFDTIAFNHFTADYTPDRPAYKKYVKKQAAFQKRAVKYVQFDLTNPTDGAVIELDMFPAMRVNQYLAGTLYAGLQSILYKEDLSERLANLNRLLYTEYKKEELTKGSLYHLTNSVVCDALKNTPELDEFMKELQEKRDSFSYYCSHFELYSDYTKPDTTFTEVTPNQVTKLKSEVLSFLRRPENDKFKSNKIGIADSLDVSKIAPKVKTIQKSNFAGNLNDDRRNKNAVHSYLFFGNVEKGKNESNTIVGKPMGLSIKDLFIQGFLSKHPELDEIPYPAKIVGDSRLSSLFAKLVTASKELKIDGFTYNELEAGAAGREFSKFEDRLKEYRKQLRERFIELVSEYHAENSDSSSSTTSTLTEYEKLQISIFKQLFNYRNSIINMQEESEERLLFDPNKFMGKNGEKVFHIDGTDYKLNELVKLISLDPKSGEEKGPIKYYTPVGEHKFVLNIRPFVKGIVIDTWQKQLFEAYIKYGISDPKQVVELIKNNKLKSESELKELADKWQLQIRYTGLAPLLEKLTKLNELIDVSKWEAQVKPQYRKATDAVIMDESTRKYILNLVQLQENYNDRVDIQHKSISFKKYGL